jgi:hypothetical protein
MDSKAQIELIINTRGILFESNSLGVGNVLALKIGYTS